MGGDNSKDSRLSLHQEEWEKVDEKPAFDVMRNKNNGRHGELHHFIIPQDKDLKEEQRKYLNRLQGGNNLVNVIGTDVQDSGFGFCGSQKIAKVMTERIPVRFSDSKILNREQEAGVLYNALRGFDTLQKENGPFDVNPRMIGYNEQGQTKVWVNQNYGMNYPSEIKKTHFQHYKGRQENLMINNILECFDEKSQGERINEPLRSELQRQPSLAQAADCISRMTNIPHEALSRTAVQNFVPMLREQPIINRQERVSSVPPPPVYQPNIHATNSIIQNSQPVNHSVNQSINQPVLNQQPVTHQQPGYNQPSLHTSVNTNQQFGQSRQRIDSMSYQQQRTSIPPSNPHMSQAPMRNSNKFSFAYQGTPQSQIR